MLTSTVCRLGVLAHLDMPTIWGGRGAQGGQKEKNLNNVIAKPAHMGSGLQHQAGAGPPRCRGSATPWLACPYGGGGTQCKGLLSQQMASQVGQNHPKFEGGKVVSAVVMPPQAHRELQGKQNKTKQNKCWLLAPVRARAPSGISGRCGSGECDG